MDTGEFSIVAAVLNNYYAVLTRDFALECNIKGPRILQHVKEDRLGGICVQMCARSEDKDLIVGKYRAWRQGVVTSKF